jgi:hypothetical protein
MRRRARSTPTSRSSTVSASSLLHNPISSMRSNIRISSLICAMFITVRRLPILENDRLCVHRLPHTFLNGLSLLLRRARVTEDQPPVELSGPADDWLVQKLWEQSEPATTDFQISGRQPFAIEPKIRFLSQDLNVDIPSARATSWRKTRAPAVHTIQFG